MSESDRLFNPNNLYEGWPEIQAGVFAAFPDPEHQELLDTIADRLSPDQTFFTSDGRLKDAVYDLLPYQKRKLGLDTSQTNRQYDRDGQDMIDRATLLAFWLHAANPNEQARGRKDGNSYLAHIIGVGGYNSSIRYRPEIVASLKLHDTVEDTPIYEAFQREDITRFFDLTPQELKAFFDYQPDQKEFYKEMTHRQLLSAFDGYEGDYAALYIKFADVMDNSASYGAHGEPEKIQKKIEEARAFYYPLARLMDANSAHIIEDNCARQAVTAGINKEETNTPKSARKPLDLNLIDSTLWDLLNENNPNFDYKTKFVTNTVSSGEIAICKIGCRFPFQENRKQILPTLQQLSQEPLVGPTVQDGRSNVRSHIARMKVFSENSNLPTMYNRYRLQYTHQKTSIRNDYKRKTPNPHVDWSETQRRELEVIVFPDSFIGLEDLCSIEPRYQHISLEHKQSMLEELKTIYRNLTYEELCEYLQFSHAYGLY